MANHARIDIDKFIPYSDDLVELLKIKKDVNILNQSLEGAKTLRSSCESDFNETRNSLEEYEKKISSCKQRIDEVKQEAVSDHDLEGLEKELEDELRKQRLLEDELRDVNNQINDLEYQRINIEAKKKIMDKSEKVELKAERKLSMYASVTNILPNLNDQTNISGHIVEGDKNIVEMFKFDPENTSTLEICNSLWKMISL